VVDVMNDRQLALKGSRMLIMGVAYKPDVADVRESPALDVIGLLREKGAHVEYYDPYVPSIEHDDWDLDSVSDPYQAARKADCVVVITDHAAIDYKALAKASSLIFDSRNAFGAAGIEDSKIERL
jgi:UDP-N-acetyl-D-glucosamine dehydrogenase